MVEFSNDSWNGYVNQYYYLQVFTTLEEELNEIILNGGKTFFVSNLQNYASNYNVLFVKQFLAKNLPLMIQHH